MRSRHWRAYSIAGGVWAAGFGAIDAVTHQQWWLMALTAGGGATTVIFGRINAQHAARKEREAHRPDYAKIQRLEIELGMREAELKPGPGLPPSALAGMVAAATGRSGWSRKPPPPPPASEPYNWKKASGWRGA